VGHEIRHEVLASKGLLDVKKAADAPAEPGEG
jgi:hypothetical protein